MRNMLIIAAALILLELLHVGLLRDTSCGGNPMVDRDANNAAFASCAMYVLGAVDMTREWQSIDPAYAPRACIPRTISAGGLILAIQEPP